MLVHVPPFTRGEGEVCAGREVVVDVMGNSYPTAFQEAFRARRLLAAAPQVCKLQQ